MALQDGTIEWWQVRGFKQQARAFAHTGLIYDLAVAPEGNLLASAGRDGKLKVWTLTAGQPDKNIAGALTQAQELPVADARKIVFLKATSLLVGEKDGRVLSVKIDPPAAATPVPTVAANP